jgi:hypothetical protein
MARVGSLVWMSLHRRFAKPATQWQAVPCLTSRLHAGAGLQGALDEAQLITWPKPGKVRPRRMLLCGSSPRAALLWNERFLRLACVQQSSYIR